jgi:hypothetical protein
VVRMSDGSLDQSGPAAVDSSIGQGRFDDNPPGKTWVGSGLR